MWAKCTKKKTYKHRKYLRVFSTENARKQPTKCAGLRAEILRISPRNSAKKDSKCSCIVFGIQLKKIQNTAEFFVGNRLFQCFPRGVIPTG
jgi:hypothetical protein